VPVGVPLHLSITSASVMNVFFVPQLGSQIYAMNGMTSRLNLQADRIGTYPGLSGHFSGDGFSDMAFDLRAMTPTAFADWVAVLKQSGTTLDATTYRALLPQGREATPHAYSAVQAGLFDDITSQRLPPGEGPHAGRPTAAVSPRAED
jgi:cytochrome o ubiquinol oxidase subunit 2